MGRMGAEAPVGISGRTLLSDSWWQKDRLSGQRLSMRAHAREADMRSLERKRLYEIFAPLDADERLPRELLIEQEIPLRGSAGAGRVPLASGTPGLTRGDELVGRRRSCRCRGGRGSACGHLGLLAISGKR